MLALLVRSRGPDGGPKGSGNGDVNSVCDLDKFLNDFENLNRGIEETEGDVVHDENGDVNQHDVNEFWGLVDVEMMSGVGHDNGEIDGKNEGVTAIMNMRMMIRKKVKMRAKVGGRRSLVQACPVAKVQVQPIDFLGCRHSGGEIGRLW
ncbi:hypothetical protein K1719_027476 [Acacia pycnantha]|nr:hypothetical protein K1719_027476 [Acacia pycnantha]